MEKVKWHGHRLRILPTMPGMLFQGLPGIHTAGNAADAPEVEGFGDQEDAPQRYRCKRGGEGFRGWHPHGAKGNEKDKEG